MDPRHDRSEPVVLLAWELGAGLGHARRLLQVALALKGRGLSPVVAARELWACTDEYREAGIPMVQAPHHLSQVPPGRGFKARGYADILAACGYQRAEALWPTVVGWDSLIDVVKPRVIVADYSPMLALAAYGRIPVVAIGDGFVLPPPDLPRLPVVRSDGTVMADEPVLLQNAAVVQARRRLPAPDNLPALIGGQAHVVCTYPETDIYAQFRARPATGPVFPAASPLPASPRRAVFAYLAADFGKTPKLMQALVNARLPVEAFIRSAPDQLKHALSNAGVTLHETPPPLDQALRQASLVVHHGGIGTMESCLALGRPQLLLPRHLEQSLNAAALHRVGVGRSLSSSFTLADAGEALAETTLSDEVSARAQEVAAGIAARGDGRSLETIVAHCEAFAGRG